MSKSITFRVHFDDASHVDIDAVSPVAARATVQAKLTSEGSSALITKIKVLKTERA